MAELENQRMALSTVEAVTKLGLIGLGFLYVCGFIVVFLNLSRYGVSFSISLLRAQYIIAGVLTFGPIVLSCLFFAVYYDFSRSRPELTAGSAVSPIWEKIKSGVRFAWYVLFGLGSVDILLRTFASPFLANNHPRSLLWANLMTLAMLGMLSVMLARSLISTWHSIRALWGEKEHRTFKHFSPVVWRALFVCMIFFLYLEYFSAQVYPEIPHSAGGGRPLIVVFLLKESQENAFAPVAADSSGSRSVPYKLLLETDSDYVVISQDPRERAIEFRRDAVVGFVVLSER